MKKSLEAFEAKNPSMRTSTTKKMIVENIILFGTTKHLV